MGEELSELALAERYCAYCREPLRLTEEIVLAQVVQVRHVGDKLDPLAVVDDDGDYLYTPKPLHLECWEDVQGCLEEQLEDVPPHEDNGSRLECEACQSGVRDWEHAMRIWPGEYRRSHRSPNGTPAITFVGVQAPEFFCLYCTLTVHLLDDGVELWNDISQEGECADCTQARCWRGEQERGCPCPCHFRTQTD